MKLKLKREDQIINVSLPLSPHFTLQKLGIEKTNLYVDRVKNNSPSQKAGFKRGDRLLALNGQPVAHWEELSKLITKEKMKTIHITILRDGVKQKISIKPESMSWFNEDGSIEDKFMIGVASAYYISYPEMEHSRIVNPVKAFSRGVTLAGKWVAVTGKVLWKLIIGSIPYRMLSGPLGIAKAAKRSFSDSIFDFLYVMAIISINLFLMNLLPIPVLDGGRLLIFVIEKIKGQSLSVAKIEAIQLIGFGVIVFFILLTLVNDIRNWNIIW